MSDDEAFDILEMIVRHVNLKKVTRNGRTEMQISIRRQDGSYDVGFSDGKHFTPGQNVLLDLAKGKRYVEIRKARAAKKVVPRLKRVK